ncbi:hypothetical protein NMG60_11026484 [Bertholletia excelsa]
MADHQRIHPVRDPETRPPPPPRPTVPLMPPGSSTSEKGDPAAHHPRLRRTIPVRPLKPPKRRSSCCCRCLCCTVCLLFLLLLSLVIAAAVVYFVFHPKIPNYSIKKLRITQLNVNNDMSLSATFTVQITARNPNEKIGIYYEGGSRISVYYTGTQLCEGSLPEFYQGPRNTTVLEVGLTGQTGNGATLLQSLQAGQQHIGTIPLDMKAKVPVRIKLGSVKMFKWKFQVRCNVVVDSLSADNVIGIKSSSCKFFRFRL